MVLNVAIAGGFGAVDAQDGAIDMTGMGVYAQEEAMSDAARDGKRGKPSEALTDRRGRSLAENCAYLKRNLRLLTSRERQIYQMGCVSPRSR